jgi:hypothetical protein
LAVEETVSPESPGEWDEGADGEGAWESAYNDSWEAGVEPDARGAVEQWKVVAVGRRPQDFLARDCLFAALRHDHRVPWFRRYLKRPDPWMEALVAHLPTGSQRRLALQCVALDYLHKAHLARVYPAVRDSFGDGEEINWFRRLWRCTPYTVRVVGRNGGQLNLRGCGYARLCPWCHARKVVALYRCIRGGPLERPAGKYLLLGKPAPVAEPFGGIDGSWRQADWLSYTQGERVRGHYGRYFGQYPGRAAETRRALSQALLDAAAPLGVEDGMLTHQLGSAQLVNGQRTFLHDLGLVAELDRDAARELVQEAGGKPGWETIEALGMGTDLDLKVRWLLLPADDPSSLRVALAGCSAEFVRSRLAPRDSGLDEAHQYTSGVRGALSWQPTFLLDDQMWLPYVEEVRHERLYRALGSWRASLAVVARDSRSSVDRKFKVAQATRFARDRQQKGNRRHGREVNDRREELLTVALEVWPQVLAGPSGGRGQPGRRKRLGELLHERDIALSRRDLDWLMKRLGPGAVRD